MYSKRLCLVPLAPSTSLTCALVHEVGQQFVPVGKASTLPSEALKQRVSGGERRSAVNREELQEDSLLISKD